MARLKRVARLLGVFCRAVRDYGDVLRLFRDGNYRDIQPLETGEKGG